MFLVTEKKKMSELKPDLTLEERKKRRRKIKIKQAAIFYGAVALVLFLMIWGLVAGIRGIAHAISAKSHSPKEPKKTVEQLISEGDRLAASYDYDQAIATIQSYGEKYVKKKDLVAAIDRYEAEKSQMVKFDDIHQITHVFFHTLLVDNQKAFDGEYTEAGYNQYMTTVGEFRQILDALYARGYVLVNLHDIAHEETDEAGNVHFAEGAIYLPEGKKPLVMSQDDVSYYTYMTGDGFASKLVIGEDGLPTCEYVQDDGTVVYGDYDLVPILAKFIDEHPDFSYRGAKATLAITGYDGVLGYRTSPTGDGYNPDDIETAKAVANRMKELGWVFASHSWGHQRYGEISADKLKEDAQKWQDEVQPILGDTDILIYAHGNDIGGMEEYSGEKYEILRSFGFRYFCNVDAHQYWVQLGDDYLRTGRRNLDGYRMYFNPEMLDDLFDAKKVYDQTRPPMKPIG